MNTTWVRQFWREFAADEDGQSTTEYILILALVVMIANTFRKQFGGIIKTLMGNLESNLQEAASQDSL